MNSLGESGGCIADRGGGGLALRSRVYHASASPRWASLASRATSAPRPTPPPTTLPQARHIHTNHPHWHRASPDHLTLQYDTDTDVSDFNVCVDLYSSIHV